MNSRAILIVCAALVLAVLAVFGGWAPSVSAQVGPTGTNCYSARYHAATDCDRLASTSLNIPATGPGAYGPTALDCFSTRFHAATDCDRLVSGVVAGKSNP